MANDNKFRFTKSNIEKLQPTDKRAYYYDAAEPSLMLQVTLNGVKTYYVYKRIHGRPTRTYLGTVDVLKSPEMAREMAAEVKVAINKGEDPHKQNRQYSNEDKLQKLFDDFVEERGRFIGRRTMVNYQSMWKTKLSKLANKRLSDIASDDLKLLHRKISETSGNYTGNHCIVLVRTIYNYAIKEERFDGRNPANAVKLNKREPRVRYMEYAELKRFFEALKTYDNETSRDAIFMLLYTGVSKSNVFEMKWADIDMEAKVWKIPQTKTDKNVTIALVEPAMEILKHRKEQAENDWVFNSPYSKSGHIVELKRAFSTILKKSKYNEFKDSRPSPYISYISYCQWS